MKFSNRSNNIIKILIVFLSLFPSLLYTKEKPENSLLVFVGELVSLKKVSSPSVINRSSDVVWTMDHKYEAAFNILEKIYGKYSKKTVTFDVYDHYGQPPFSKFKNSLMFVSQRKDGSFYHEKYQYFDLYKTKNGNWATCGNPYKFDSNLVKIVQPKRVPFNGIVAYQIDSFVYDEEQIKKAFPSTFFTVINPAI